MKGVRCSGPHRACAEAPRYLKPLLTLALAVAVTAVTIAAVGRCGRDDAGERPVHVANESAGELLHERTPTAPAPGGVGRPRPTPDAADESLRRLEGDLLRAAALTDAEARRRTWLATCTRLAENDPAGALALAAQFERDEACAALQESIVQQWARADASAAWAWASRQPAGESRDRLRAGVVWVWSQSQPLAAVRVVEEMIPGPERDETSLAVVHQWARRDPTGALAWIDRFPAGEWQDRALAEMESIIARRLGRGASP